MSRSSADYYDVLRVSRHATQEEIKAAYRTRAKELHPDRNRSVDTTADFQVLQEAFSVLGSPERRTLYDAGNVAAAVDPSTPATEVEFEPVHCDGCGCVSAQSRFVQYDRVVSVLFASFRSRPAGVFCPNCASRRLFWSTLVTGSVGVLGVWGLIWSIIAISRNLCGGIRPAGLNAFLLAKQAGYFRQNGHNEVAQALAGESLGCFARSFPAASDHALGKTGAEFARTILGEGAHRRFRLKSQWSGWPAPARNALIGLVVAAALWTFVFAVACAHDSKPVRARASAATGSTGAPRPSPSSESEKVEMTSEDGRVYRVSRTDYRRLDVLRERLINRRGLLSFEADQAALRSREIENRRSAIDTTSGEEVDRFNHDVRDWNERQANINMKIAELQADIDSFNAELARVGRLVR